MIDINRLVGSEALLIPGNNNVARIGVSIIGYGESRTLIATPKDKTLALSDYALNSTYQFRASVGNVAYTFNTSISVAEHESKTYFHVAVPENSSQQVERRLHRIPVSHASMTLSVNTGREQVKASMADISLNGAQLVAKQRLAKVDEVFYIDMLVDHGTATITLPCKVRYVRTDAQTSGQESIVFHHGVEFGDLTENAEQFIESFIRVSG